MKLTASFQKIADEYLGNNNYGGVYLRLYARVSSAGYDIVNNRTKVYTKSTLYIEKYTVYTGKTTTKELSCTGLTPVSESANGTYQQGETTLCETSGYITHENDGKKSITVSGKFYSSPWGWNKTATATVELPTIPRASSVSCSSPYIGDVATITIGKNASEFTSNVTYHIGELTGTIAENTSETVLQLETEPLKEQIYALMPNAKSISATIRCRTYSGSTKIGDTQVANFNLYAKEEDCKPTVTGEVVDTNESTIALTGDSSIIVKNASKPKVTVTAEPKLSSTIKSYSINLNDGQTASEQEYTFDTINSNKITVNSIDSRGYSNPCDIDLIDRIVDYVKLHFNSIELPRPEGTSNEIILNCDGVWFNGNFKEDTPNTLKINFQYRLSGETEWIDGGEITPTIEGNKFSFNNYSLGNLFDYNSEYQFKIIATDLLMTVGDTNKETIPVPKGQEVWYECEDGIGVYGHIWLNDKEVPISRNEKNDSLIDTYSCNYINSLHPNIITDGEPIKAGYKIDEKDVWVKRCTLGELPNNTEIIYDVGITSNEAQIEDVKITSIGSYQHIMPNMYLKVLLIPTGLAIFTDKNLSGPTAFATLYYTLKD